MKEFVPQVYLAKCTPNSTAVGQESQAESQLPHDGSDEDSQPTLETALVEKIEPAPGFHEAPKSPKARKSRRTDSGKLHRVQHGILSREALAALVQLGEDLKSLRRLERQYRAALRPPGPIGNLIFDRFWSSYLRLLLISRLETRLTAGKSAGQSTGSRKLDSWALAPGPQPTLVCEDLSGQPSELIPLTEDLPPDLLHNLVLAQRYDRNHSREMYRALALLLLLRRGGEAALEGWASEMLGGRPAKRQED
jgi:hypothetical protein